MFADGALLCRLFCRAEGVRAFLIKGSPDRPIHHSPHFDAHRHSDTCRYPGTPAPTPFSLIWMADTQAYSYHAPELLEQTGKWVKNRIEQDNVIAVLHSGDMVDNGYKDWQWENFDRALSQFEELVPFYAVAGNHDMGVKRLRYDAYQKRPFLDAIPAEQKWDGGAVFYETFSAGGTEFLLLGVGFESTEQDPNAYEWMDSVLKAHPGHVVIVLFHRYLKADGEVYNQSKEDAERIVAKHENVRLVLCGHNRDHAVRYDSFDDDADGVAERSVCCLMYNFQENKEDVAIRLLRFDPVKRTISEETYSVLRDTEFFDPKTNTIPNHLIENGF